jgi:hypothetical protein
VLDPRIQAHCELDLEHVRLEREHGLELERSRELLLRERSGCRRWLKLPASFGVVAW